MTLPLTPETLRAAYDYLCSTPPFCKWSLPESDDVLFKVVRTRLKTAWYQWDGERHTITASQGRISQTITLMQAIGHEMIHLHLEEIGMESRAHSCDTHNAAFRVLAAQVCKIHGWDAKAFF